jgi:pyrimidine-specific ribonucleoside hydrolase
MDPITSLGSDARRQSRMLTATLTRCPQPTTRVERGVCRYGGSETAEGAYAATLEFATRDPQFAGLAASSGAAGPLPPPLTGTPIILDVDAGGDPDDAITVACAARLPELKLVLTADEIDGERARFVRYLLDLLGRPEVSVVAGADLGNRRYWVVDGMTPAAVASQPDDVLGAVRAVCAASDRPVRWVGCGPMTTLAHILRTAPELAERLVITQMGGAINYRDRSRAEHIVPA